LSCYEKLDPTSFGGTREPQGGPRRPGLDEPEPSRAKEASF
jgi:hypothetical protein